MILGEILSLLSFTPKLKQFLEQKTIQSDVVDIIDDELSKQYPYFKSKILIDFFDDKNIIQLIQKIRKGENVDDELSQLLTNFLNKKKILIHDPLDMLRLFIQELEQKIVNSSTSIEKLTYKHIKKIEDNQISKSIVEDSHTKICEMNEMMKKISGTLNSNENYSKNIYFKEFMLKWPDNWEKMTRDEIDSINENVNNLLEKRGRCGINPSDYKLDIKRKTTRSYLAPVVTISMRPINYTNLDAHYDSNAQFILKEKFEISESSKNYDERSFTWNLKIPKETLPEFTFNEDIHQIQKYFFKNDFQFILTLNKVYESMLKKSPEISDEIALILQSFAIL